MAKHKALVKVLRSMITGFKTYQRVPAQDLKNAWARIRNPQFRLQSRQMMKLFFKRFYRRIVSENILKEAASLTYITILGFIPFIMFIVMLAPDLPFLNLKDKISAVVMNNFIPSSANAVNGVFEDMLNRRAGFNIFSFSMLIVTSYSLFKVIRDTFDRILSVDFRYSEGLLNQMLKFLGTIIFGTLIMVLLFSSSSLPFITKLLNIGALQWLMYVIPFVLQFLSLVFLYTLMPSAKVKRKSLFRGAFWTTVVWVLAKGGFDFYILRLTNFQAVYGVLAALPIFLMWIFVNWVIVLGGIVLVSVLNNDVENEKCPQQPKNRIRVTLEMYSDTKMNARLEKILGREDLLELTDALDDEIE